MSSNPGEAAPASRSAAPRSAEVGVAALSPMGPVLSPTMVICFDFPLRDPRRRARPGPLRGRRHRGSGNHLDSFTPASLFTAAIVTLTRLHGCSPVPEAASRPYVSLGPGLLALSRS